MPYSTRLEGLIEQALSDEQDLDKKKMFGGIGYLLHGNMCFGIHKDNLVLRTTPEYASELMDKPGYRPFDITGSAMKGWVMIEPSIYQNSEILRHLLNEGIRFASALPAK